METKCKQLGEVSFYRTLIDSHLISSMMGHTHQTIAQRGQKIMDESIERFDTRRELDEIDQLIVEEIVRGADNRLLSKEECERIIAECNRKSTTLREIEEKVTGVSNRGIHEVRREAVVETFDGFDIQSLKEDDVATILESLTQSLPGSYGIYKLSLHQILDLTSEEMFLFEYSLRQTESDCTTRSVRYGIVDGTLYIWKPDLTPTKLENAYGSLYHYFRDRELFDNYVSDVAAALGFNGDKEIIILEYMEELAQQLIIEPLDKNCINPRYHRIRGDHLKLMNDISGKKLSDIQEYILKVTRKGGKGGIENPIYFEGERYEIALARLTAVASTDCHLKLNGTLEYFEPDLERIRLVQENIRKFGVATLNPKMVERDNVYVSYIPSPYGVILQHLGIPSGDRTIQNPGLPSFILDGTWKVKCAYIEDLIPQDGSVYGYTIAWFHSNVLHAGDKTEKYGFHPRIGYHEIDFIRKYGNPEKHANALPFAKLLQIRDSEDIQNSKDKQIAEILIRRIYQNKNNLIEDSKKLVDSMGIEIEVSPTTIRYHKRSGRVSVAWTARTAGLYETIKLAIIAPSNDVVKRGALREILISNPDEADKASKELANKGIKAIIWWND